MTDQKEPSQQRIRKRIDETRSRVEDKVDEVLDKTKEQAQRARSETKSWWDQFKGRFRGNSPK
ncbi:MAG TPA: hypothetical protein VJ742_13210 [Nitrososphaera sp.]|nr:hypothetical protein [Nitrososphaera sp.]